MPELPEVEIAAEKLRHWCVGHRITQVRAQPGTPLRDVTPKRLATGLWGHRVTSVDRRGKQLFVRLDGDLVLLLHLGMTGRLADLESEPSDRPPRLELVLDQKRRIGFIDPRRFGRVRLLSAAAAERHPEVKKLGPDALEIARVRDGLARCLAGTRLPIKLALMDQHRLAGVGNIYASEALFEAGIHPDTPASALAPAALAKLGRALDRVMRRTLVRARRMGRIKYLHEGAENTFRVYGRAGEPCPRCHTEIERMAHGGRGTFYCPRCQPRPITSRGLSRAGPRRSRSRGAGGPK